ncbi:MAG: tRNA pseudouridine(38-40) synthase TruA [Rhodospirillaceae bacterium]|jgi:tRNA pseudouridine38-40 synthase|nr:tRNA pseudouridine(38-40) synthase TruA [Rhodospirillaceae bacterium]MBT5459670.1 tRNA pseudouridine(38-40) synthase TruA [Rhodospirillaceae bacterium]
MTRYKLTLEYDGTDFVGWQRQTNGASIQEELERAVHGFCGETVTAYGAGRTDAGVHALGQVAHIDIQRETVPDTVRDAINAHLRPHPIAVRDAEAVSDDFHARFSAVERSYLYRILNRRAPPAILRGQVWYVPGDLDAAAMNEAAQILVGNHDFTSFRATLCQAKSPVKTLDLLSVTRDGEEILVRAEARSFLHHQVRNMVGTLKLVGDGKWTVADVAAALAAKDRAKGGPTSPAEGLYLTAVRYPPTTR